MNVIQVQKQLERLPDQTITGYVQNPTPDVPQYLALAELQRRQKLRAQRATQPQPSVADELLSGVAGLPDVGPYNDKGYKAGGIVAFASGDYIATPYGSGGNSYDERMRQAKKRMEERLARERQGLPIPPLSTEGIELSPMENLSLNLPPMVGGNTPKINPADGWANIQNIGPTFIPTAKSVREPIAQPSKQPVAPSMAPTARGVDTYLPPHFSQFVLPVPNYNMPREVAPRFPTVKGPEPNSQSTQKPTQQAGRSGIAAMTTPNLVRGAAPQFKYDPIAFDENAWNANIPAAVTAAAEAQRFKDMLGPNTGYEQQRASIEKMQSELQTQKDRAPWMALVNAGLAMAAGQSPNALSNIASGGIEGLKAYTGSIKEQREAQEKIMGLTQQIENARRDEQRAIAQFGESSAQANNAERRRAILEGQKQKLDIAQTNAKGSYQAQTDSANYALKERELAQRAAIEAANRASNEKIANLRAGSMGLAGLGADKNQVRYLLDSYKARLKDLSTSFTPEAVQEKADLIDQIKALEERLATGIVPTGASTTPRQDFSGFSIVGKK